MSEKKTVDARGFSCPEPVLMTKTALKELGDQALCVMVSSACARDNVERTLTETGRQCTVREDGEDWIIEASAK